MICVKTCKKDKKFFARAIYYVYVQSHIHGQLYFANKVLDKFNSLSFERYVSFFPIIPPCIFDSQRLLKILRIPKNTKKLKQKKHFLF